jgi:hypothetical protein
MKNVNPQKPLDGSKDVFLLGMHSGVSVLFQGIWGKLLPLM